MRILTLTLAVVSLAAPLLAGLPAEAITARQYAFQGQGIYFTSKGVPEGYIGVSAQPEGFYGNSVANPPRDLEHHGRYFSGN